MTSMAISLGSRRNRSVLSARLFRRWGRVFSLGVLVGCTGLPPKGPPPMASCPSSTAARSARLGQEGNHWARELAESGSPEALAALHAQLENAATPDIVALLDAPSIKTRQAAADYLIFHRPRSWREVANRWQNRPDLERVAATDLCRWKNQGPETGDPAERDALLLELAERAKDAEARGESLVCAASTHPEEARAIALAWLKIQDRGLVRSALLALGRSNAWFEVTSILKYASDPDPGVRSGAVAGLGMITSPQAAQALLTIARQGPDEDLRELAWKAWLGHPEHRAGTLSTTEAKRLLSPLVSQILRFLRQKNLDLLARLVHPERGLRLGLCAHFIPSGLAPAQVRRLLRDDAEKNWGGACQEKDRELLFEDYLDYVTGYEEAPVIGYNRWPIEVRATAQLRPEVGAVERSFPDGVFVDLVFPEGRDQQTPGESLVMVFVRSAEQYRLVGLLQAQSPNIQNAQIHLPPPLVSPPEP